MFNAKNARNLTFHNIGQRHPQLKQTIENATYLGKFHTTYQVEAEEVRPLTEFLTSLGYTVFSQSIKAQDSKYYQEWYLEISW